MGEPVDEDGLDVFLVGVEAETAEEQGARLFLARPRAADDPRNSVRDLVD